MSSKGPCRHRQFLLNKLLGHFQLYVVKFKGFSKEIYYYNIKIKFMIANPKTHKCYISNTLHTMLAIRENNEGFRFVVSALYIY